MEQEVRCPSRLFAVLKDGLLEVKCKSTRCGWQPGVLVLHYFDPGTLVLVDTKRYREPNSIFNRTKEKQP